MILQYLNMPLGYNEIGAQRQWLLGQQQSLLAQQMSALLTQNALMPPPALIDRCMLAELEYHAKNFSQHWLNAMLDVELGL